MSTPLRILLALAIFATTAVIGVGVGRTLRGDSEPAPPVQAAPFLLDEAADTPRIDGDSSTEPDELSADAEAFADALPDPTRLVPVIAPVAVGFDDRIGDELLALEPPGPNQFGPGASAGFQSPVIVGATPISDPSPSQSARLDTEPTPPDTTDTDTDTEATDSDASDTAPAEDAASDSTVPARSDGEDIADDEGVGDDVADEGGDEGVDASDMPAGSSLWFIDLFAGFADRLGLIRFDPCAGVEPGTPTPEDCPKGYGATFDFALRMPPGPMIFFGQGHYLSPTVDGGRACPADTTPPGPDEAALTVFSRTPLVSGDLRYRPYGSSLEWTTLPMPPSSGEETAWWTDQFDTIEYSPDWGTLPICFNVPRDPSVAWEMIATGIDVFDRVITSHTGLIPIFSPDQRPPTTGEVIGLSSVAVVTSRSVAEGMVEMRSRPVTGPDDDLSCDGTVDVTVSRAGRSGVIPIGIYDPAYSTPWVARVPIPPGGQVVVCADIFPTSNPLRRTATDRLLFSAATQERPRIVLQGIRRLGDSTISPGMSIRAGFGGDPCSSWYRNEDPIEPGRPHPVEHALWECVSGPLGVGADGSIDVPVKVSRTVGSGAGRTVREEELAIPIRLQPCSDPTGCGRPREWYEIPIPTASSQMCGTSFGTGGCGEPLAPDGIAVIRVEYPVVAGPPDAPVPGRGAATLLDQVEPTLGDTPRYQFQAIDFVPSAAGDPLDRDARVRLVTDRPLQIEMLPVESQPPGIAAPPGCDAPAPASSTDFSDSFELEMSGFCAGVGYRFPFRATDEAGMVFEIEPYSAHSIPAIGAPMRVRVDFLGGPETPDFGWLYRFGVSLDGQNPTAYWWDWTGRRGTGDQCFALNGTTARSRGALQTIYLWPGDLDVEVRMTITTTGDTDCSGRSESGLGELSFTGSFSREQLFSGEPLVLESGPDLAVPIRLTVDVVGEWRSSR
jgi:hypothetical protein